MVIVGPFEVDEVDIEECCRATGFRSRSHVLFDSLHKRAPVIEAGETVNTGEYEQFVLGIDLLNSDANALRHAGQ